MKLKPWALIVAFFLPKKLKYVAMLDYFDDLPEGVLQVDCPQYTLWVKKELK